MPPLLLVSPWRSPLDAHADKQGGRLAASFGCSPPAMPVSMAAPMVRASALSVSIPPASLPSSRKI